MERYKKTFKIREPKDPLEDLLLTESNKLELDNCEIEVRNDRIEITNIVRD